MKAQKFVTLPEFLTEAQIAHAIQLFNMFGNDATTRIQADVIEPNLSAINAKLGQDNDARYLAYSVVFVLTQAARALS